ncbi:nucleoside diphosphate phosphatase ENTPD5 isoform X3 [Leguminivora glycinivorella]|uniref:nucleoside diphosphate phosphatase ENTPD5 isoform X3 n=1 Tax=Leguminivora glycinivorella TaxID=1035111 RepID=UPI00200D2540|nr:nucleoside diphosphate phosphatase ENTPD5 isoform X3 [Leguminivora glycinivorella]
MADVRRRKLKDDSSAPNINIRSNRSLKPPRRLKKTFILLIVAALCMTYFMGLFAGQTQWFDGLAKSLGYESERHYSVIIDAGSSGSRVLAYKFRVPFTLDQGLAKLYNVLNEIIAKYIPLDTRFKKLFGQPNLDLEEEYFEQSKPGLSSFADDPAKGADTIVQLIKKAEFLTPLEKRRNTPLIIRATAGLRLLPQEKARKLLEAVSNAVGKLGYDTRAGIEIMDPADEGIFIWYTINLLHRSPTHGPFHYIMEGETMAALDLGGGSTQITYQLTPQDAFKVPSKDLHVVPTSSANLTVYTHSYLGLGMLAARRGIFKSESGNDSVDIVSSCVEPIVSGEKWTYANVEYTISGASRPANMKREAAFERCYKIVTSYVKATLDWEPKHPPKGKVAAMSFFYEVAADAGLIDVMKGGTISVSAYRQAALRACGASNVEQPFACIDLSFCLALLQQGYKIPDHSPVSLFKKVNGHEVSWALGLAYTSVVNRLAEAKV